ncbi:MAG: hypothetical protein R2722_18410 [Tessaracoccus sp.]
MRRSQPPSAEVTSARASQLVAFTDVRRFRTPDGGIDEAYAELSLRMRDRDDPGQIFDELHERGLIQTGTPGEVLERLPKPSRSSSRPAAAPSPSRRRTRPRSRSTTPCTSVWSTPA